MVRVATIVLGAALTGCAGPQIQPVATLPGVESGCHDPALQVTGPQQASGVPDACDSPSIPVVLDDAHIDKATARGHSRAKRLDAIRAAHATAVP